MMARTAPGIMKTQPHPSDREVLAGLVERVTYQNVRSGLWLAFAERRQRHMGHDCKIVCRSLLPSTIDYSKDLAESNFLRGRQDAGAPIPFGTDCRV